MSDCITAALSALGTALAIAGIIGACVFTGGWACVVAIIGGGLIAAGAAWATYYFMQRCLRSRRG